MKPTLDTDAYVTGRKEQPQAAAAARQTLRKTAAQIWNVPVGELTTKAGVLSHSGGKSAKYGDVTSKVATVPVPKNILSKLTWIQPD